MSALQGVRVLLTRPKERSAALSFLLEDAGAEIVELPLLELAPPEDPRPLRAAAEQLHRQHWVLFASERAVEAFLEAVREAGTRPHLERLRLGAVGPATARALQRHGLEVHAQAQGGGQALFDLIEGQLEAGAPVLLPAAEGGRVELEEALRAHGCVVTRVNAYRAASGPVEPGVLEGLRERPPGAVVLSSPRGVDALVDAVGGSEASLLEEARLVAIGPTTAERIRELGLTSAEVAAEPTPEALVDALERALSSRAGMA